jgi:hypothetical protein
MPDVLPFLSELAMHALPTELGLLLLASLSINFRPPLVLLLLGPLPLLKAFWTPRVL